ncbi:MAG: hypothetical protein GX925_03190 [Clostridiales bacterium]|nr:hypothetical protein [Clostridiales bacterium]
MWGLHSNDKKREKCFFTQSDDSVHPGQTESSAPFLYNLPFLPHYFVSQNIIS